MKQKKQNNNKAFTLIEIVLIMFIVSFTFVGIYATLAKIAQHEKDTRYNMIATNLAQEGVEIIRNLRDENVIHKPLPRSIDTGLPVFNWLSDTCVPFWDGSDPSCVDPNRPWFGGNMSTAMCLDNNDFYYQCPDSHHNYTNPLFRRECTVYEASNSTIRINCEVRWKSPTLGINKKVEVYTYLTNWQ